MMQFFHEQRLLRLINELAELRYHDRIFLNEFICYDDDGDIGRHQPNRNAQSFVMRIGDRWVGRDKYLWLTLKVDIPDEWQNSVVVGLFDFGRTGEGQNSGFESLLFVNGKPFQGVDTNHQEVIFDVAETGLSLDLKFRLWSGLEGGGVTYDQRHELRRAEVALLNQDCDDLYFTALSALQTVESLDANAPEKTILLNILNKTFQKVDFGESDPGKFNISIIAALDFINKSTGELKTDRSLDVTCIGHTHIDLAWLWRIKHTREKAARSFSTVNRLMSRYDDYVFLQTQPQIYEFIKEDYPEIYTQIRHWVKEGRWEAGGAMWVEADCNVISGESLIRQIVYGIRFFEREFGVVNTYLWLPDVFGYSWALPQIMNLCGLDTFITTKLSWNEFNKMPHDTFKWRGMDGSEVTTHFITTPDTGGEDTWYYTYNGLIEAQTVTGIWNRYSDKGINQDLLLSYGYGDGGGGVNRHMLEMRRRLDKMPGLPRVKTGRVDDYVKRLNDSIQSDHGGYLHTWNGELYLEYHRGTYTSQGFIKRANRHLEFDLRETEFLCTLCAIQQMSWQSYPQPEIHAVWKILLRNQFHDIIPGSSIKEVYEDSRVEYATANEYLENCQKPALSDLVDGAEKQDVAIINTASWRRDGLVSLPLANFEGSIHEKDGPSLPIQIENDHVIVQLSQVPPLGMSHLIVDVHATTPEISPFVFSEKRVETPFYIIEWNEFGHLCRIYHKSAKREVIPAGASANVLQVFEDKPRKFDAWEIEVAFEQKQERILKLIQTKLICDGSLKISIQFIWQYRASQIVQEMVLYSQTERIDFQTEVDWQERDKLLKVAFCVDIHAADATYDIQLGNVKRPTHRNTSWDHAKFEVVGHQWADLSEQGYGVALLNDCKYGYDVHGNVLRLTLLKSPSFPDPEADKGQHFFTYALLPHIGSWLEGCVVQQAWDLNCPMKSILGKPAYGSASIFYCDNPNVIIDVVKKAEDDDSLILRLHEFAGSRGNITIQSDFAIQAWQPCNLLEQPTSAEKNTAHITDNITPYQIKTYRVMIENSR